MGRREEELGVSLQSVIQGTDATLLKYPEELFKLQMDGEGLIFHFAFFLLLQNIK